MRRAVVQLLIVLVIPQICTAQGLAVGIGATAVDRDSFESPEPQTASVRVALSRVAIDVDWMSKTESADFFDSGPSRVLPLNDRLGEYGRNTRQSDYTREAAGISLVMRSRLERVTGWGGGGVAVVRSTVRHRSTWTGCSGPWVAHCTTGNYDYANKRTEAGPQVVGGVDFNITRWVDVFAAGRTAILAGGFDAGVTGGVRLSIVPELRDGPRVWATMADGTERAGRLVSRSAHGLTLRQPGGTIVIPGSDVRLLEKPDSTLNGAIWGLIFGALAGWEIRSHGSHRGLAGGMLAGVGIGLAIDELIAGRKVMK